VPHHYAVNAAANPSPRVAPHRSAVHLLGLGTMLTTLGLLLLFAGLIARPSPPASPLRDWLHSQLVDDRETTAWRPMPARRPWSRTGLHRHTERAKIPAIHALEQATLTSLPRRRNSEHRTENAHVAVHPISAPASTHDRNSVDQSVPGIVRADLQQKVRLAGSCRRTWADSAHEAALPLCRDARSALASIVGRGPSGSEAVDLRWDLMEMAGAQHGLWTRSCPCPMDAESNPMEGPR
jgi:hypothetical protein